MVYNGDEVSAVVVDFGSHTTRGGFAGEDGPRVVTPSFYGYMNVEEDTPPATNGDGDGGNDDPMDGSTEKKEKKKGKRKFFFGDDGVSVWRKDMEIGSFMVDGIVNDAEAAGQMLSYVLRSRMGVDPTEHPLMLTEPAWSTPASRETLAQLAFEGEGVPAMYFGSSGVLSAFAAGKPTALVLDVGYANSSTVPVVEGYALRAGTMRQPLASSLVLAQLHHHFQTPTPTRAFPLSLLPRQLIARRDTSVDPGTQPRPGLREDRGEGTTASWRAWAEQGVVENWKEACSELVSARGFDIRTATNLPQVLYEFPDGYQQYFGEERYRFTEMLYDPKNYFDQSYEPPALLRATPSSDHSHSLKDAVSLSQLVHDSIMACDVDVRAALLQNIVVVGNTSLTRGLTERLDVELATLMPSQKIKIHSPSIPYERKYSAWLGGSVLASLGTFHQLWVTKDEYEEHGMNIVHQRCNPSKGADEITEAIAGLNLNADGSIKHYRAGKWDPLANKYVWPQGRTAVVQVADSRTVVVYHIPIDGVLGPGLKAVLNDPTRLKLGVNISMDARKLHRDELIENTSSLLELSHVARLVDPDAWTRSGRLISLARLTQHYLGVPLDKNEGIREGAWSHDLNSVQIEYAANDAYVGVLIYNAMVRRAEERGITADLTMLKMQVAIPQFSAPAVKLAESTRRHPAVVAATRAGAKPRQSLALSLFVAGGSVSDLATALHISTRTVQGYVAQAAQLIPADEYEGYGELAVRLCEAFPIDSYPAVRNVEFFKKLRSIASARDKADRVPVHHVQEHEWGPDY
ncbi:hypothetical protein CspHIS471_0207220 [Cutaneotrichosporon sp. HIS471]|nr:hypothetical protein CspHIS471_0207220 [Cutaneotrichosporon sp. HIS471]